MKGLKRLLSYARRAADDYSMIEEGDKIAVGVSAGKDSLSLLWTMAELRRFYPKKFELMAITIDMKFDDLGGGRKPTDYSEVEELCRRIHVEYRVVPSNIAKIVFDIRKENNPCSLCAKLRRGMLNDAAKSFGCNKVALGHHFDDAVQTFMLNLFYEGRIGCFAPVTYLDRSDITVIRPLVYAQEKDKIFRSARRSACGGKLMPRKQAHGARGNEAAPARSGKGKQGTAPQDIRCYAESGRGRLLRVAHKAL